MLNYVRKLNEHILKSGGRNKYACFAMISTFEVRSAAFFYPFLFTSMWIDRKNILEEPFAKT